jgi:hypothetical protein
MASNHKTEKWRKVMNELNKIREKLNELSAQLDSIEQRDKSSRVRKRVPVGERYFLVNLCGEVVSYTEHGSALDQQCFEFGNYDLTREAAQLRADRQFALTRITDKMRELQGDSTLDELEPEQLGYRLYFDSIKAEASYFISPHNVYSGLSELHTTKEAGQWIAENMSDDVRLYLTGERA